MLFGLQWPLQRTQLGVLGSHCKPFSTALHHCLSLPAVMTLSTRVIIRLFLDLVLGQTRKACRLAARRFLYMCLSCRLHMSALLSYLSRALRVGARSPRGDSPPEPNRDHDLIPLHSEAVISSLAYRVPAPQAPAEEIAHGAYDSRSARSSAEDVIVPSLCPPPAVHTNRDRPGLPTTANIIHRTPSRHRTLDIILDNSGENERENRPRSCANPDSRPPEYAGSGSLTPCSGNETVAPSLVELDKGEEVLEISVKAIHPENVRRWDRDIFMYVTLYALHAGFL